MGNICVTKLCYEFKTYRDIMSGANYIRANAHKYQPQAYHMRKHMILYFMYSNKVGER